MSTQSLPDRLPKYRHYRPKNLAVVRIDGHDHYLGRHDSPESREKYRRLIAQWLATGQAEPPRESAPASAGPTVKEIIAAYWRHAQTYYRNPNGAAWHELDNIRVALRPLKRLYGDTPAATFDALALQAIRADLIRGGLCRTTVNGRIAKIRRAFKWAGSVKLVPGSVHHELVTVEGLKPNRSDAPEPRGIKPVAVVTVEATLPHLPRPVAAMVRVQLLTGCRVGEIVSMRGGDLTQGETTWEYRPGWHKNSWRGQVRVIILGPQALAVVRDFLGPDPAAYLFSPRAAVAEQQERRGESRRSKRTPSERVRRARKPGAGRAAHYTPRAYHQAIVRACDKAGVPRWAPLQLRHTCASILAARFGLELTAAILGHADPGTTLLYAQRDTARAKAIMSEVG